MRGRIGSTASWEDSPNQVSTLEEAGRVLAAGHSLHAVKSDLVNSLRMLEMALPGVAQCTEHRPGN